ncbi:toprim domain-containing protein [Methyloversatilis sp.]|uniref:toprim domain-containing protein n=1 Tax=Methyloversatilis sp. TaxID=2569862 RepID=UPI002735F2F7|nr:toprim domain-containing protein [Methyloversatilis sp.]MDP3579119.1 toprim domain-containing protein [Methyloversatilis sp.]
MDSRLHADITARLDRDYAFKPRDKHLREGVCPQCGKKSLWTWQESPWVLKCDRLSKCGAEYHVKELYPDLFERWTERHPVTPENPYAAADAYLKMARGFDLARIKGWYTQETYFDPSIKAGSSTVRFALQGGGYWERIIDQPGRFGSRKATFRGSYAHTWWAPPGIDLTDIKGNRELWIVEGIFDAIALLHVGITAVSALSCNNDCAASLAALAEACAAAKVDRPKVIWALDADKAGRSFTRKWVKASQEAGWTTIAAQIPQTGRAKLDWNDMFQRDRLKPSDIDTYLYHGALLTAQSAGDKALLMYQRGAGSSFPFEFGNRLYWFKLDLEKYTAASNAIEEEDGEKKLSKQEVRERALANAHAVNEIATCYPQALYYQRDSVTDDSWYYLRVSFPNDTAPVKNTFTSAQLASGAEFKKRLLGMAQGAIYTGSTGMLDALWKQQLRFITSVETIDFIGYSREHTCYVFGNVAVSKGRTYELNDDDYFEIGRLSVKSLNGSVGLQINPDAKRFTTEWVDAIWEAFGAKGVVALAFWFGALYAEQIRALAKSYPFLEVVGEPGAGKSTLIEFLWKLCGRLDYEGFDPSKSTLAARARNFAQVSNLPVVLIEADRGDDSKKGGFDWDELKTAYNGRSVRARGVKDGGNATYEPPFRGAVVISQNADVNASEAILSRIVHLHFDRSAQTPQSRAAAEQLERTEMESVSGFILRAAQREEEVLKCFVEKVAEAEKALSAVREIRNVRVIKNHAQIMALVLCLVRIGILPKHYAAAGWNQLIECAKARQEAISADHPLVAEFWEIFDYLEDGGEFSDGLLNHSRDTSVIAISLPHFEQVCGDRKLKFPPIPDLKRVLRTSRQHKFIDVRTVNSRLHEAYNKRVHVNSSNPVTKPQSVKCWCFEA